ncbi:MAG: Ldh family oxidoreductase [Thermodesulfobacteriota bacterium]
MPDRFLVSHRELASFISALLERLDVPAGDAAVTAHCLVTAHLRGFDTHGLPCLAGYVDCLEQKRIKARPEIRIEKSKPWAFRLDADNGLGQVAAYRAMELALEAADEFGIGAVAVRRSNHFGAASCYSLSALPRDCLGLVTSNAAAAAAPYGAVEPFLGTNPLSVALPALKMPPFVLDMATSEGSRKKVRQALVEGKPLPPGWALDQEGRPTTDPRQALEGVMLPFGGMKGSAVTLLLDILSGVLSGAEFGGRVLSVFTNQERESGNGHFMLAFKIAAFLPVEVFKARLDEELERVRELKPVEGIKEVIYPGYREHFIERERRERGIPLEARLVEETRMMGRKYGVNFPAGL